MEFHCHGDWFDPNKYLILYTFLGAGKLILFIQILQKECDRQTRKLVEQFKNKRDFDLRVSTYTNIIRHFD